MYECDHVCMYRYRFWGSLFSLRTLAFWGDLSTSGHLVLGGDLSTSGHQLDLILPPCGVGIYFCIFGYGHLGISFFNMPYYSWFVWFIGHFGHCFKAQPPKPYFVLAQNIKLVHSFMTGRMNLPVPVVYGTMLAKPFYSGVFGGGSHLSIYVFNMFHLWNGTLLHSSHAFLNNSSSCRSLGI